MRHPLQLFAAAFLVLSVAGCLPPVPPPVTEYRATEPIAPLVIAFAPQGTTLSPVDLDRLRALQPILPVQSLPELYVSGPLALLRARAVRNALGRPVLVYPAAAVLPSGQANRPDDAVLLLPTLAGILPDACRGPGQFDAADIWPGDDARRTRLLPAGCATAASIQAQAVRGGDLLLGRTLPEGASIPFADAIERYYRRNEGGQARSSSAAPGASSSGGTTVVQPAGAAAAIFNNPLLGPLPGAGSPAGSLVQ